VAIWEWLGGFNEPDWVMQTSLVRCELELTAISLLPWHRRLATRLTGVAEPANFVINGGMLSMALSTLDDSYKPIATTAQPDSPAPQPD